MENVKQVLSIHPLKTSNSRFAMDVAPKTHNPLSPCTSIRFHKVPPTPPPLVTDPRVPEFEYETFCHLSLVLI